MSDDGSDMRNMGGFGHLDWRAGTRFGGFVKDRVWVEKRGGGRKAEVWCIWGILETGMDGGKVGFIGRRVESMERKKRGRMAVDSKCFQSFVLLVGQ